MKKSFLSIKQRSTLKRWFQQFIGAVLITLAVLSCVALVTYNPDDPGVFSATINMPTNQLGQPGAYAADFAIRFIGYAAAVIPVVLFAWGYKLVRDAPVSRKFWIMPFATIFLLPVVAGLMSLHRPGESWFFDMGLGGIIGDEVLRGILQLTGGINDAPLPILRGLAVSLPLSIILLYFSCGMRWQRIKSISNFLLDGEREVFGLLKSTGKTVGNKISLPSRLGKTSQNGNNATDKKEKIPLIRRANPLSERQEPSVGNTSLVVRPDEKPEEPVKVKDKSRRKSSSVPSYTGDFALPPMILLQEAPKKRSSNTRLSNQALKEQAQNLEAVLDDYGIRGEIIDVRPGPVVTLYELEPAPGLKASRVISLADDIARSMSALSARVSTVPGRNVIGIELPNEDRETVYLSQLLQHESYIDESSLALALGKDIAGEPVMANLAKMPHLLIAGTTGSGKSVAINTMILSLLYKHTPKQCRMIMIDP